MRIKLAAAAMMVLIIVSYGCSAIFPTIPPNQTPGIETPTVTATPTATSTPINGLIISGAAGTIDYCGYTSPSWTCFPMSPSFSVKISYMGTPVQSASVTINSTPLSYDSDTGIYGRYTCPYFSSGSYTLTVNYGGKSYSAAASVPGSNVYLDPSDFSDITWYSAGNYNWINVTKISSTTTFYASDFSGSPYAIPASAYPDIPGSYRVIVSLENRTQMSNLTANDYGYFSAGTQYWREFTR